jgi:uncharacterized membrane protein YdbT with pleckstrin-like domain
LPAGRICPADFFGMPMHKVNKYLLKNTVYIFLLANILALLFQGERWFVWLNILALILCILVYGLIRLTIQRYTSVFGKSREEIVDLLGRYIEDDRRGKQSFYDYLMIKSMQGQSSG